MQLQHLALRLVGYNDDPHDHSHEEARLYLYITKLVSWISHPNLNTLYCFIYETEEDREIVFSESLDYVEDDHSRAISTVRMVSPNDCLMAAISFL